MTTAMTRQTLLHIDVFAQRCALHPDLVRRFVALGLIEPTVRRDGGLWFSTSQITLVGRMQRLRNDLALNYSALGLVLELLDRIEQLETAPAQRTHQLPEI